MYKALALVLCMIPVITFSGCRDEVTANAANAAKAIPNSTKASSVTALAADGTVTEATIETTVTVTPAVTTSPDESAETTSATTTAVTTTTTTAPPTTTVTTTTPKPVNFTPLDKTVYAKWYLQFMQNPYSTAAVYRYIPTNSALKVSAVSEDGSWLRVTFSGITGYVQASGTTETKPVITTTTPRTTTTRATTTFPSVGGGLSEGTDPSTGRDINKLKADIEALLAKTKGQWSVYVKNLRTGEMLSINNRQYYAASLIKLFGMAAAYQAVEDGRVTEASMTPLLKPMIIYSDNNSFNSIVLKLGKTDVHDWIEKNGYTHTRQQQGFTQFSSNYEQTVISDEENLTTAEDCGMLLESIFRGECVSKSASQKMLELLCQQYWTHKIPAGIPDGITVANKTGDVTSNNHDCAIVFLPDDPYIICVLSEQNDNTALGYTYTIINISKLTYNYFTSGK